MLSYDNLERLRLKVNIVESEVCYCTKEGAVKIRLGGDDANVFFGEGWIIGIQH